MVGAGVNRLVSWGAELAPNRDEKLGYFWVAQVRAGLRFEASYVVLS